jgi:hypothetical protein
LIENNLQIKAVEGRRHQYFSKEDNFHLLSSIDNS